MKYVKLFITCCFAVFIILGARYVWLAYTNLRGARPAFGPPAGNIVKEIEKSADNTTGFPLSLPSGFSISIFAKDLGGPRVLAFDPTGTLLVSIPSQGKVVALPDRNGDGSADGIVTVIEGLNKPHGLAFQPTTKKLYIAETDQVAVYDYDPATLRATNKKKIVDLPGGGNHVSRTIGFGPDGMLYISVGSSCNVCVETDQRRAAILVADVIGFNPVTTKLFASGLRNSVFFTWHPLTKELWATEMGRDLIGDDIPPDEVNIIKQNNFYGWPYCYGKSVRDTTFADLKGLHIFGFPEGVTLSDVCTRATPSHIDIPAHSAPLGIAFVPSKISNTSEAEGVNKIAAAKILTPSSLWSEEYQGDLLVAFHGSWNRSIPTGYKVVRMKLDEKGVYIGAEDFITGWLGNASAATGALGRPVDLLFDQRGNLYISDDKAGVVYRILSQRSQ